MLVCDTSGLVAYFDQSDRYHWAVNIAVEADEGPFVVSPYVVAELDHLMASRRGADARLAVLGELASGAWELAGLDAHDFGQAREVVDRHRDQGIGLADASLVVLAQRYRTDRLLSLDQRHLGVLRTLEGGEFRLVP